MTIEEAIKILEKHLNPDPAKNYKPVADAVKLGIEALDWIKEWRKQPHVYGYGLLEGETEE